MPTSFASLVNNIKRSAQIQQDKEDKISIIGAAQNIIQKADERCFTAVSRAVS